MSTVSQFKKIYTKDDLNRNMYILEFSPKGFMSENLLYLIILTISMENLCLNRISLLFRRKTCYHYCIVSMTISLVLAHSPGFFTVSQKEMCNCKQSIITEGKYFLIIFSCVTNSNVLNISRLLSLLKNDGLVQIIEDL